MRNQGGLSAERLDPNVHREQSLRHRAADVAEQRGAYRRQRQGHASTYRVTGRTVACHLRGIDERHSGSSQHRQRLGWILYRVPGLAGTAQPLCLSHMAPCAAVLADS